jgi:hypothetical protein
MVLLQSTDIADAHEILSEYSKSGSKRDTTTHCWTGWKESISQPGIATPCMR